MRIPIALLALSLACGPAAAPPAPMPAGPPTLVPQSSGTTQRLQAISPVSDQVAWASGTGGTWVVTVDGGDHWRAGVVPGADSLEFRDVHAVSADEAYLLSAGTGTASRIYHTRDGGRTWTLQFQNTDPAGFYDCFAFWDSRRGLVMADGVAGTFPAHRTTDGRNWVNIGGRLPAATEGEGAFAASGTCVATAGTRSAWIATGAGPQARVFASTDGGDTWRAFTTPIKQGTGSSGIFSIAFRDAENGIIAGGDYGAGTVFSDNVAVSRDGGETWGLVSRSPFPGAVFGAAYVPGAGGLVVITGPAGAAWSPDEGQTWNPLEGSRNYWAVAFASGRAGWLVGTEGRIVRISFRA